MTFTAFKRRARRPQTAATTQSALVSGLTQKVTPGNSLNFSRSWEREVNERWPRLSSPS